MSDPNPEKQLQSLAPDPSVHECSACRTDPAEIANSRRHGYEFGHVRCRSSRTTALDAKAFMRLAGLPRCLALRQELRQIRSKNERRLPLVQGRQTRP